MGSWFAGGKMLKDITKQQTMDQEMTPAESV